MVINKIPPLLYVSSGGNIAQYSRKGIVPPCISNLLPLQAKRQEQLLNSRENVHDPSPCGSSAAHLRVCRDELSPRKQDAILSHMESAPLAEAISHGPRALKMEKPLKSQT